MADDPRKKGADAKRISQQPHEQAYQRRKAKAGKNNRSEERSARGGRPGESREGSAGRGSSR